MLVWFHSFPEEPEVMIDNQLFEQIDLSAFMTTSDNVQAKKLFSGDFNEFISFLSNGNSYKDVEVILPANEVLYTNVTVPSKSLNRIKQALPFLIEDLLVSDVHKQYFALGDIKSGKCNIAIVRQFIVEIIFEQFKKFSLPASIITSEVFYLPWHENKWSLGFLNDNFIIRTGIQSGETNNIQNIEFVLRLLLNNAKSSNHSESSTDEDISNSDDTNIEKDSQQESEFSNSFFPESLIIYASEELDIIPKITAIAQEYQIEIEVVKGNLLKFALSDKKNNKNDTNQLGINLLQGEYLPSNLKQDKFPFKKTLMFFIILAVISQVFYMGYQWKIYNDINIELQTELEQLYFKTFPESKKLIDVRAQTESNFKQLQNNASPGSSFLSLLGIVGNEVRLNKEIRIQTLQYNDGILQLDIQSKGFVFNKLKSNLENKYNIVIQEKSSSRVKGKVHSIVSFKLNDN